VESRSIFPYERKDPITIKEACECFMGKQRSMPEQLLYGEIEKVEAPVIKMRQGFRK